MDKEENALKRVFKMREEKLTKEEFFERKDIREASIKQINVEIEQLESIRKFHELWNDTDSAYVKNRLLKATIDKILYIRIDDEIQLSINFH